MTTAALPSEDRLLELLADEATQGLSEQEARELEELLGRHGAADRHALEHAAAALDIALSVRGRKLSDLEPMPEHVRRSIPVPQPAQPLRLVGATKAVPAQSRPSAWASLGWLAAAACAVFAAIGWYGRSAVPVGTSTPVAWSRSDVEKLKQAGDVRVVSWTKATDPTGAGCEGEVVWSPTRQEGYMVFRGLKANDPRVEQYQLWIFDPGRDERYPVHGGVFNIGDPSGETVVKIVPRLAVPNASAFVITVEKPGGVWVSDRSRIPVLAKVQS